VIHGVLQVIRSYFLPMQSLCASASLTLGLSAQVPDSTFVLNLKLA